MKRRMKVSLAVLVGVMTCVGLLFASEATAPAGLKTTEFGHGPTVVLVHSLGANRLVWMPTAKKLLAGHHVVMVDLPGHGESPLPDPFSLQACAEALDQVLAKQKPDSTVLVAQGIAGMLALKEVQAHGDRVRGLMVIDAATHASMKIPEQQQQFFLQMLDTRYDEMLKRMTMSPGRDTTEGLQIFAMAQQVPPATMKAYWRAMMNEDVSGALKDLKPAFQFVGSSRLWPDTTTWVTVAKQLGYDDAGAVTARRIGNCGALIMKEQPDSLAAVIDEFSARAIAGRK